MAYTDAVISGTESSGELLCIGYCDICIQGLTAGSVQLQYKLPITAVLTAPVWTNFPDGDFSANTFSTIFISDHGVYLRLTGVSVNAGTYVKLAKYWDK